MTSFDIDAALAAANPLSAQAAEALPLHDAEAELRDRIVATPSRSPQDRRPRRARAVTLSRRRVGLVLAATAVIAAVLALLPSSERSVGPQPAFAAALVRFANHSPKVLLKLPGWRVVFVEQDPNGYGEMHFVRGHPGMGASPTATVHATTPKPRSISYKTEAPIINRVASLTWTSASAQVRRYDARGREDAPTGLGVVAHRYVNEGGAPGAIDLSAYFIYRGRELHFRATVSSMAMYRQELRALTAVDTSTWLRAMPPSVIRSADSGAQVRQMLKGIPRPPGFDPSKIRGATLVQNRYYLGTEVTGTVACMWIGDWFQARRDGNRAMVKRAVAAMATAPHWPVFRWMDKQGAWGPVLISYGKAMRQDHIVEGSSHPLYPADVNDGLGCSQLGVRIGR
jgi:hypothetical protein